jgi:hypothetical protein
MHNLPVNCDKIGKINESVYNILATLIFPP